MTAAPAIAYDQLVRKFLGAQLAGDVREALRIVIDDALRLGARISDVQTKVIRAAQHEIGHLWQANRISIAQEHLATGISQVVLARLYDHAAPRERNGRTVAVACVEGEQHDLPARLVADYLDNAGFIVRYYGANVPTDDLVRQIVAEPPALIALSVTMSFNVGALRNAVTRLRSELADTPILIGGRALEWATDLTQTLRVETAPPTPEELVAAVRRMTRLS
ncbi:MAG: B12-binding domain-containing protein [Kofleriaceae bacterium]